MTRLALAIILAVSIGGFAGVSQARADTPTRIATHSATQHSATQHSAVQRSRGVEDHSLLMSMPEGPLKKCGFDSDCSHGKCKSGKCGGCGFDSDCKGWGKCKSGQCGGCGFDSECKGFGKCSSGKCTKSPYK